MRLKQRSSVDLPQPEGPISAVTRFCGIGIVIRSMAWNVP